MVMIEVIVMVDGGRNKDKEEKEEKKWGLFERRINEQEKIKEKKERNERIVKLKMR